MRLPTAGQSLAAVALCLILVCLGIGFSALFLTGALRRPNQQPQQLQDSARREDGNRSSGTREERPAGASSEFVRPAGPSSEFVRPVKVWPLASRDGGDQAWEPTPLEFRHRDTGHFRGMQAQLWDPHPRYEFKGFGRTFRLDLRLDKPVTSPGFKVLHVWENTSKLEEPRLNSRGCMYTGEVVGDPLSQVSLSLCHGMRGHIWTSEGSYTIEPAEDWQGPSHNPLHILSRLPTLEHSCYHHFEDDYSDSHEGEAEHPDDHWLSDDTPSAERWTAGDGLSEAGRRRKRSASGEYNIELMVMTDWKMKEFHGNDLEHYIINLISAVDKIFKDPSIGNPVNVVLVKIVAHHSPKDWAKYNSSVMLEKFCTKQQELNELDSHPEHHDAAILLTRDKLCRVGRNGQYICPSIGIAEVGQVCSDNKGCALVKDIGLSTVFTIAHELGHVLGLPHDNDSRCNRFLSSSDKPYLMASSLSSEARPWSWSNCSRHLLTSFLEGRNGWCLQDPPGHDLGNKYHKKQLLGEKFGLDKQCELVYGKGYKLCPRLNTCEELWCQNNTADTCITVHAPWADGTPCDDGKWCQKRLCVFREYLKPIDGGWSKWQRYGACSRTCGGGVQLSIRECNNPTPQNGGKYCLGERVRHHSCNTAECPPGSKDFRKEQCAIFDNQTFNLVGLSPQVKWIPKYDGISLEERCKLYCRNSEDNQHFELKEKVIDGTVCGPNTFDICVNGICLPAGCDHVLHSKKQLDYCGQCGGDNSTCKVISGSYNITAINNNYISVITIPAGASNIEVRQHGYLNSNMDTNSLALFDNETGQYILNGKWKISQFRKLIVFGGITLEYSGTNAVVEKIRSSLPLTKDLNVQVFSYATYYPPDITYQYTMAKHSLYQFAWELSDEWTPCDKECNGEMWRIYKCMRGKDEFSSELCDEMERRESPRASCNTDCNTKWEAIGRSECSSDCGPGYREIQFQCVLEKNGQSIPSHESTCQYTPKPVDTEPCVGQCITPKWVFSEWGECSKSCGTGRKIRTAHCMDSFEQKKNDSECPVSEKKTEELCNKQECPTWQVGEWTQCPVTCGGGKRHRAYWCQYDSKRDTNEKCPLPLPVITDSCNNDPCPFWKEEEWSECSVSCGKGEMTRNVYCSLPQACSNNTKPLTTRPCYMPECSLGHANAIPGDPTNRFTWRKKWTDCSVTCGRGETHSSVECHDNIHDKATDFRNCAGQYSPTQGKIEICYMPPCPRWVVDWEPCSAICGPGTQSKRISCESHNGIVPDSACPSELKPRREEKPCNIICHQRSDGLNEWITLPWSQCSVSCGAGVMERKVTCHGQCPGPKPQTKAPCEAGPCADEGFWNAGQWSECSATCGEGTQERQIRCESQEGEILPDSFCSGPMPPRRQQCKTVSCKPVYKWEVTRWTPCSSSCGKGMRKRRVECKSTRGETVSPHFCQRVKKRPKDRKDCMRAQCLFDWNEGDWSQCSSSCGSGLQTRKVRCVKNDVTVKVRKEQMEVDERHCSTKTKPDHKRPCKGICNNKYKWEPGVWHPCSNPCDKKGKQKRNLYCYHGKKKVPLKYCPQELRPERRRKCDTIQCSSCQAWKQGFNARQDGEYHLWLKGRNVSIYCYNMLENNPKEYITLPNDNYAEIFSPSLRHASKCVSRSITPDHCNSEWGQTLHGFTYFKKVHINISNLVIDSSDWTFATTIKGIPVGYGEAGDCHTRGLCPEGEFTINLQSTGFRVSPATTWVGLGEQHAPPNIHVTQEGQKVIGRCGGCCGFCKPRNGLKLDLLPP